MIGIVPREIRGHADKMMLGQGERFRMAIAKEGKQADGGSGKE
jgi:hypothetical protein